MFVYFSHHKGVISNCSFTHDERKFATCSWDKSVLVWDIATGMYRKNGPLVLAEGHEGSVSSCFINDDGLTCVSVGYDGRLVLWNISYGIPKLILRVNMRLALLKRFVQAVQKVFSFYKLNKVFYLKKHVFFSDPKSSDLNLKFEYVAFL